jgi:uncharacterized membrane protein HdeD (DUF308 family)
LTQNGVPLAGSEQENTTDLKARLWWITMIRGGAALGLGIGLLAWPASTTETLLRFMALYWLSSGVMSLVRAIRGDRRGRVLFLVTGIVGIVGGLFVLVHPLLTATVSFATLAVMFGIVAILAGLLHIFAGFSTSASVGRRWSAGSFLLGVVEVILGVIVMASPGDPSRITYVVATIWALIGGGGLLADSIRLRRLARVLRRAANG